MTFSRITWCWYCSICSIIQCRFLLFASKLGGQATLFISKNSALLSMSAFKRCTNFLKRRRFPLQERAHPFFLSFLSCIIYMPLSVKVDCSLSCTDEDRTGCMLSMMKAFSCHLLAQLLSGQERHVLAPTLSNQHFGGQDRHRDVPFCSEASVTSIKVCLTETLHMAVVMRH